MAWVWPLATMIMTAIEDIFISGVGNFALYHNNRNGTFTDVSASSGIRATQWGSSPLWFDYDNDGKLDLFVGEFADYSNNRLCNQAESYGGMGKDSTAAGDWLSLLQSTSTYSNAQSSLSKPR